MSKTPTFYTQLKCPHCGNEFTPGVFTEPIIDNYRVTRWVASIACSTCGTVITSALVKAPPKQKGKL